MGLLATHAPSAPTKKPESDDVLLLLGMLLACAADGSVGPEETDLLQSFYGTVPEFRGKDFQKMLARVNEVVARHGNLAASVAALREISNEHTRRKCYILAADLALASGEVSAEEDRLLARMQETFGIDDAWAQGALTVLAAKYR
jgi:uncharacterized tellurite resistance protein B-like protein